MKIGRIILLLLGLCILALAGKAFMGMDTMEEALRGAVVLNSPVVLPENEGKLIVVYGRPDIVAPVYDEELGLTLQTIKAVRHKKVYEDTEVKEEVYDWKWVTKGSKTLLGEANVGEFALSDEMIGGLPVESDYNEFDVQEISHYTLDEPKNGSSMQYVLPKDAYYYWEETATNIDQDRITREYNRAYALEREGTAAYRYRYFDAQRYGEMTFVGRQQGNTLVGSGVDGVLGVHTEVKTHEELVESNKNSLAGGSGFGMACGAVLILLGLRGGRKKKQK